MLKLENFTENDEVAFLTGFLSQNKRFCNLKSAIASFFMAHITHVNKNEYLVFVLWS